MFGCLRLAAPTPSEEARKALGQLAHHLGWGSPARRCLEEQFLAVWARAWGCKRSKEATDRAAWMQTVKRDRHPELRSFLQIALAFLLTETDCERSFAQEKRQYS